MTGFVNLTHKVAHSMLFRYFKIEISLHTTAMDMCRHRIPHTSRSQFGHPHLQLTGGQHLIYQHLVDITMIRTFQRSHFSNYSIGFSHLFIGIIAMSGQ